MTDPVAFSIDEAFDSEPKDKARQYIGASGVGDQCDAAMAFSLRGFPNVAPSGQLKRIFRDGHRIEDMVVADLKKAGFVVWENDPATGKQYAYEEFGGHIRAHADGHIELDHRWPGCQQGDIGLLEIKSMNDAKWGVFTDSGVRASHPLYYWQAQFMMGMSGIKQTIFVAYNKNNGRYSSEFVEYIEQDFQSLQFRVQIVLENKARKISDDEADWRCRGCFKRGVCWQGDPVAADCSKCAHAAADPDHRWYCMKHQQAATAVCQDYELYHPLPK